MPEPTRPRQAKGAAVLIGLAVILLVCVLVAVATLLRDVAGEMSQLESAHVAPATADGPLNRVWSVSLSRPLIYEMAVAPGRAGEFLALNDNRVLRFDASGARAGEFEVPSRSSRIATDPTGAIPHVLVVSSAAKWKGATTHKETTDCFLHALDMAGQEVWKKRFDPKETSTLEPFVARLSSRPTIVLGASRRILALDAQGNELWNIALWHHPGTVTAVDPSGTGDGMLLAAKAPGQEIVRIDADGEIRGIWGSGKGPTRFRALTTGSPGSALSLRPVYGTPGGARNLLAFYDAGGAVVSEAEIPREAQTLAYSPVVPLDVDGRGRVNWVIGLGDGTILMFSPQGEEVVRHSTGERLRSILAVPQHQGPDLLVGATHRGLTVWRPMPERIRQAR